MVCEALGEPVSAAQALARNNVAPPKSVNWDASELNCIHVACSDVGSPTKVAREQSSPASTAQLGCSGGGEQSPEEHEADLHERLALSEKERDQLREENEELAAALSKANRRVAVFMCAERRRYIV